MAQLSLTIFLGKEGKREFLRTALSVILLIGVVFLSRLAMYNASDVLNLICVANLDIPVCVLLVTMTFFSPIIWSHLSMFIIVVFFTLQNKVVGMTSTSKN